MTYFDRIKQAVHGDWNDRETRLIAYAYYMGREEQARHLCDEYSKRFLKMRESAKSKRYYKMINKILDEAGGDEIYSPDYSGGVRNELCIEEIN